MGVTKLELRQVQGPPDSETGATIFADVLARIGPLLAAFPAEDARAIQWALDAILLHVDVQRGAARVDKNCHSDRVYRLRLMRRLLHFWPFSSRKLQVTKIVTGQAVK